VSEPSPGSDLGVVVNRDDHAKVYVGHAPALNLYSQGRTEQEALRAIEHAVRLYVSVVAGRGYLHRLPVGAVASPLVAR
jgi:hypothetical protein